MPLLLRISPPLPSRLRHRRLQGLRQLPAHRRQSSLRPPLQRLNLLPRPNRRRHPRRLRWWCPSGTSLTVRLGSALSSKTSHSGDTFQATTSSSIRKNGEVLIPAGSTVSGVVVTAKERGKIKGQGELDLQLTSINVHGRSYPLSTAVVEQTLKGKGKRTAVTTAGGGGAGALIGGLAGGGRGSADWSGSGRGPRALWEEL